MEALVPWKALLDLIEPHCPVAGRGRRPYITSSMLRVRLRQKWFALSDPTMAEALYEIATLRAFAHLILGEPIPDESTRPERASRGTSACGRTSRWTLSRASAERRRAWTARTCSGTSPRGRATSQSWPRGAERPRS